MSGEAAPLGPAFELVELPAVADHEIRAHGRTAYPEEACGILLGPLPKGSGQARQVARVQAVPNRKGEDRGHRFLIPAQELREAERSALQEGYEVLGFYHSHPDHPARPSAFDRDHAWPWYAYLVLRVQSGVPQELNAFELEPEARVFQPRGLKVVPVT